MTGRRWPQRSPPSSARSRRSSSGSSPGRGHIVDRYGAITGRPYRHDEFYRALGTLKLGVITEGFFRTHLDDSPNAKPTYPAMRMVPFVLAEQGRAVLDGEVPLRG